jgi:hypothetical protein
MPTKVYSSSNSFHRCFKFLINFAVFVTVLLVTDQKISHHRLWRSASSLETTEVKHTTSKDMFESRTTSFFVYSKGCSHTSLASCLLVVARSMKPRPGNQEGRYMTVLTFKAFCENSVEQEGGCSLLKGKVCKRAVFSGIASFAMMSVNLCTSLTKGWSCDLMPYVNDSAVVAAKLQ